MSRRSRCSRVNEMVGNDPDIFLLTDPNRVDAEVVNAFQRRAEVVLQRSLREGFGFTATETMWKGRPVIATPATGLAYQIRHEVNGIIADGTETCADYLVGLLKCPDWAQSLGQAAIESVRANHLLPVMVDDYLAILESLAV